MPLSMTIAAAVRVDMDVEFGRRRHIAEFRNRPAHHHQFADLAGDLRALTSAIAILVNGPRAHKVIVPGWAARNVSTRKSTPCCDCSSIVGSGSNSRFAAGFAVNMFCHRERPPK